MDKKTATQKFLTSNAITVCELRAVETKHSKEKPEEKKASKPYLSYRVLLGNDSADVMLFAKGKDPLPLPLTFKVGDKCVVTGFFGRNKYGVSCMADSIELLTD